MKITTIKRRVGTRALRLGGTLITARVIASERHDGQDYRHPTLEIGHVDSEGGFKQHAALRFQQHRIGGVHDGVPLSRGLLTQRGWSHCYAPALCASGVSYYYDRQRTARILTLLDRLDKIEHRLDAADRADAPKRCFRRRAAYADALFRIIDLLSHAGVAVEVIREDVEPRRRWDGGYHGTIAIGVRFPAGAASA